MAIVSESSFPQPMASEPTHIVGATGRSGQALAQALLARGATIIPVIRNPARWHLPIPPRIADLESPQTLHHALQDATHIVSCAHARHIPAILAAAPPPPASSSSAAPANSPAGPTTTATASSTASAPSSPPAAPASSSTPP